MGVVCSLINLNYSVYIHLKDLIAKNLEKISQLYPTDRKRAILPTTKPSVTLTTEFALKVSTTLSTAVEHQQNQRNAEKDSEVLDLIGEDVIGNFDQIIIDQDQDGAIIVTKKKKECQKRWRLVPRVIGTGRF